MRILARSRIIAGFFAVLVALPSGAQNSEPFPAGQQWRLSLLAPLNTKFSRKGDIVSARVLEPANFEGSILEGEVRDVKPGGSAGRSSRIEFDFHTLHTGDKILQVSAVLLQAMNSRKETGLDEGGAALDTPGRGAKSVLGVFSHSAAAPIRLNDKAPQLSLAVSSELLLQLQLKKAR